MGGSEEHHHDGFSYDDANMSPAIKDVWGRLNISFLYGNSGILSRVETMLWRCFVML